MKSEVGSKTWNNEMFQKHATPYSGIAGFIQKKRLQRISKVIKQSSTQLAGTIVEVGCEEGNLLKYLIKRFPSFKYVGYDISSDALNKARNLLPSIIDLYEYDLTSGPLTMDGKPSFLICSETLEHIPDSISAIENIANSVEKDTIVIITVPIERYKNQIKTWLVKLRLFNLFFKGIEEALSEWHVQDFSKEDIIGLLGNQFDVISYDTILLMHQLIVVKKKTNV